MRFDAKTVIVTGAGNGLGREYALQLAARGAKVVVNDLGGTTDGQGDDSSAAQKVVDEIKAAGGEAAPNFDSVASPEGGAAIVQTALDAFGRCDGVIANAGILRDKSLVKMTPDEFDLVLKVHLYGTFNVAQPAFAWMKDNGGGRIVVTTSTASLYGTFGQANYGAAKMGLVGMMQTMAIEGARADIKVNAIAPTAATRLTSNIPGMDVDETDPEKNPMSPGRIAPVALALAHDSCPASGEIFIAAAGWVSRTALTLGQGARLSAYTPEAVFEKWDAIRDLSSAELAGDGAKVWNTLQERAGLAES